MPTVIFKPVRDVSGARSRALILVEGFDDGGAEELGLVGLVRHKIQTHGRNIGLRSTESESCLRRPTIVD